MDQQQGAGSKAQAGSALRRLPRSVLCNRVNTWGRERGGPHAPKQTFHQFHGAQGVRSLSVLPLARG